MNSFKQYLLENDEILREFDASDLQLQQDHRDNQERGKKDTEVADKFKSQMDAKRMDDGSQSKEGEPTKGDVLQSPSGKQFVIQGRSNTGFRVQQLGGNNKQGNLPHGKKYSAVGKTKLGKTIFKVV